MVKSLLPIRVLDAEWRVTGLKLGLIFHQSMTESVEGQLKALKVLK